MLFKKIFFFLFLISSVSVPGYYFYQRSKSKKEESYSVNNKEEVQEEEEIQEETEEAALVEINGWLDCFFLNTVVYLFMFYLFLTLFTARLNMMVMSEVDKVTEEKITSFFVLHQQNVHQLTNQNISNIIENKRQEYFHELTKPTEKDIAVIKDQFLRLNVIKYCFDKQRIIYDDNMDLMQLIQNDKEINLKMKFPTIFFIISFIIIQILLGYDLYFLMKSFWQVGFQKTFENLHWLDLFAIEKVFRRNSITKKIVFLVSLIFTAGFTFARTFFKKYRPKEQTFSIDINVNIFSKVAGKKFKSSLTQEEIQNIESQASEELTQTSKKTS